MSDFEYKVSVIVPVYNVEQYLRGCLDSLLAQTIDHDQMEVLLINDGSVDNSLGICEEYAELFSCFKVFSQENAGPAAARNTGIGNAHGKYIMYLDSDDTITPETVKAVTDYFDTVYDMVDMVTYYDQPYKDGKKLSPHPRYKYLKKSGIYDLNKYPYIMQTRLSVCVKNLKDENFYFGTSFTLIHEDQEYINEILANKMKIGYCDKGEYSYLKNDTSIMATSNHALSVFEPTALYYEKLFAGYETIPEYYQSMFVHDISWKLKTSTLIPYNDYDNAIKKLSSLLDKIDDEIILSHPSTDNFHRHFFLSLKGDSAKSVIWISKEGISIVKNNMILYKTNKPEIVVSKIEVKKDELLIIGFLKSVAFNYVAERPVIYAVSNFEKKSLEIFDSANSFYKSSEHTNNFWGFKYSTNCRELKELYFSVEIDGFSLPTSLFFIPSAVFNVKLGIDSFVRDSYKIMLKGNRLLFDHIPQNEIVKFEMCRVFPDNVSPEVYQIRKLVLTDISNKRIWLYSDHHSIGIDNAFYQFQHDWEKNDGIVRYYVCDKNKDEIAHYFTDEQAKNLIEFGSRMHKIVFLSAEYVLTSFVDNRPKIPFQSDSEYAYYRDLKQPEIIYLQHGILHADLRWLQSVEKSKCDKIVVSSFFEIENYINNYNYSKDDLIPCGMPRYDHINKEAVPKNRLLFAPSWRSYFLKKDSDAVWQSNYSQLMKSNYFNKFMDFLNNPQLAKILEDNDLYLDAKLHPHMKSVLDMFKPNSERINITTDQVNVEDYKIFITDISSYVFDYAYLSRPVIYFMPDMDEFISGMNHYRSLDLPWDKAFGNLVTKPEEAVDEIVRTINNDFAPDPVFKERMDKFYLELKNCSEELYAYLIREDNI